MSVLLDRALLLKALFEARRKPAARRSCPRPRQTGCCARRCSAVPFPLAQWDQLSRSEPVTIAANRFVNHSKPPGNSVGRLENDSLRYKPFPEIASATK